MSDVPREEDVSSLAACVSCYRQWHLEGVHLLWVCLVVDCTVLYDDASCQPRWQWICNVQCATAQRVGVPPAACVPRQAFEGGTDGLFLLHLAAAVPPSPSRNIVPLNTSHPSHPATLPSPALPLPAAPRPASIKKTQKQTTYEKV
ncbi:hypothetical protein E2C01_096302 [Portunus trituberculatus]|uniref:Uncharacterized protein n=1 Tax=Portunus trituberculatus TaxID=210409 RepID=A0A5B7JSA4_PORTR|nr:hypothetical protein [Portunus trituberculatus]